MPRMPLAPENKSKSNYDFPKLTLEQGGRARICLMDPEPEVQYVHTMRALVVINGTLQMETQRDSKGSETSVPKTEFVGRHICLGSYDVISTKGIDREGCPVCLRSTQDDSVRPPERRFALNVLQYATAPGSFTLEDPFQCSVKVWGFTNQRYDMLTDLAAEWGDLRKVDINLGPCTSKQWQKYDIQPAAQCAWLKDEGTQSLAAQVFKNNAIEDLTVAIGRKLSREQVLEDLAKVTERYEAAYGRGIHTPADEQQIDVVSILDTATTTAQPVTPVTVKAETPVAEEPIQQSEAADPAILDLDSILNMD